MIRWLQKARRLLSLVHKIEKTSNQLEFHGSETHVHMDAKAVHRYLLNLHQWAESSGERLVIHTTLISIIKAHNFDHGGYHEAAYGRCYFSIGTAPSSSAVLNCHYFQPSDAYRIPIGYHPLFIPPEPLETTFKEPNSIQFFGSTHDSYNGFNSSFWQMPSRIETLSRVQSQYPEFGSRETDMTKYKEALCATEYFLCLPGVHMPLCHNLYECISCGCVPLLHAQYVKWLAPELQNLLKPVTYSSDEELMDWMHQIKTGEFLPDRNALASDLVEHCKHCLDWASIKFALSRSSVSLICAEEVSVHLAMTEARKK